MAAQEKVPIPEQELAKDLVSIRDRPTSASLASPLFSSTLADFTSCTQTICFVMHHRTLKSTGQGKLGTVCVD